MFDNTERTVVALVRPLIVDYLRAIDVASRAAIPLTARQRQLMTLVMDGFSNA